MTAAEICRACGKENSPRVDDVPFCSSCCEAGWDIAYARGQADANLEILSELEDEFLLQHRIFAVGDSLKHAFKILRARLLRRVAGPRAR